MQEKLFVDFCFFLADNELWFSSAPLSRSLRRKRMRRGNRGQPNTAIFVTFGWLYMGQLSITIFTQITR